MKLIDQVQNIDKSKVAQDIAKSFLAGFLIAAVRLLLPLVDVTSFGASLQHITQSAINPIWLYHFFDDSFTSAISVSVGLRLKSAFDSFTLNAIEISPRAVAPQNTVPEPPPPTHLTDKIDS